MRPGDGDEKESDKKTLASLLCHVLEEAFFLCPAVTQEER